MYTEQDVRKAKEEAFNEGALWVSQETHRLGLFSTHLVGTVSIMGRTARDEARTRYRPREQYTFVVPGFVQHTRRYVLSYDGEAAGFTCEKVQGDTKVGTKGWTLYGLLEYLSRELGGKDVPVETYEALVKLRRDA